MYIYVTAIVYSIMHSGIFCKVSHIKTIIKLLYQNSSLTHACMHTYLLSKYIYASFKSNTSSCVLQNDVRFQVGWGGGSKISWYILLQSAKGTGLSSKKESPGVIFQFVQHMHARA